MGIGPVRYFGSPRTYKYTATQYYRCTGRGSKNSLWSYYRSAPPGVRA